MKESCKAVRLIHGLPAVSKAYFRRVYRQSGLDNQHAHSAFGCIPGRRREEAITIQQICGARLTSAGFSHSTSYFDVANAFPSVSFE
eukprot:6816998-Heterocapsa_arctica.AAC.1